MNTLDQREARPLRPLGPEDPLVLARRVHHSRLPVPLVLARRVRHQLPPVPGHLLVQRIPLVRPVRLNLGVLEVLVNLEVLVGPLALRVQPHLRVLPVQPRLPILLVQPVRLTLEDLGSLVNLEVLADLPVQPRQ